MLMPLTLATSVLASARFASGGEFSPYTLSPGMEKWRFERIQLAAFRVTHMPELARNFDGDIWKQERSATNTVPGATP